METRDRIAAGLSSAVSIGFGAPAPGRTNRALYTMATIDGVRGPYRSDDAGVSWVRINDDQHQYGNAGQAITGDPSVYGRVYLGTDGRGVLVAEPAGPPTSTTTTRPPTTTTSRPPTTSSPPPLTTTSRPPTDTGGCSATFVGIGQWGTGSGGFQGEVRIANTATTGTTTVTMTFTNGQTLPQIWGGRTTTPGTSPYTVLNESWNGALSPGQTATFGFLGNWNAANDPPTVSCARTP